MANPQLENGYLRIANELVDALIASEFTGREFRIILAIIRYSYGWNKKEASLTVKQIHQVTGLSPENKSTIYRTLRRLITANVINQVADYTYRLNKDYIRWQIDQRRYKPLTCPRSGRQELQTITPEVANHYTDSCIEVTKKLQTITPEVANHYTESDTVKPEKHNNGDDLSDVAQNLHKDIFFKDIYKDISLRERLFKRLKESFSGIDLTQLRALVNRHPERVDFFIYLCETFKIDPMYVKNPIAYITSLRPISFPDYDTRREKERERERELEEAKAQREEVRRRYYEKEHYDVKELVSSFVKKL